MSEIYAYVGELGAGKTHLSTQQMRALKYDGNSVLVIAWADPLKHIMKEFLAVKKSGLDLKDDTKFEYDQTQRWIHGLADRTEYLKNGLWEAFCPIVMRACGKCTSIHYDHFSEAFEKHGAELAGALRQTADAVDDASYMIGYRKIIQLVGTEFGRAIHTNLWVDTVLNLVREAFDKGIAQAAVIDDVRFSNEFDALEQLRLNGMSVKITGVVAPIEIRSERTGMTIEKLREQANHGSEIEIPALLLRLPPENIIENI